MTVSIFDKSLRDVVCFAAVLCENGYAVLMLLLEQDSLFVLSSSVPAREDRKKKGEETGRRKEKTRGATVEIDHDSENHRKCGQPEPPLVFLH